MASKVWDDLSMWNVDFSHVSSNLFDLKRVNELELAMLEAFDYVVKVSAGDYAKYYFQLRSLIARLKFNNDPSVSSSLRVGSSDGAKISSDGSKGDSKGGIEQEDEGDNNNKLPKAEVYELLPLDIMGARRLQLATEKYDYDTRHSEAQRRRSTSTLAPYKSDGIGLGGAAAGVAGLALGDGDDEVVVPVPLNIRRFQSDAMDSLGHHHIASEINRIHHPVLLEQLMHAEHNDADGVAHISSKNHTPLARGLAREVIREAKANASTISRGNSGSSGGGGGGGGSSYF